MPIKYDVGELLEVMRFEVEGLLLEAKTKYGDKIPNCLSQSHRALRALGCIDREIEQLMTHTDTPRLERIKQLAWHRRIKDRLEKFLAVHTTITIIERRDRDPDLDIFGMERKED